MTAPIHDPDLYARMSVPRPAAEVATAWEAFFADLGVLREKHGIRDVVVVGTCALKVAEGKDTHAMMVGHRGDSALVIDLLAMALGGLRKQARERIDEVASGKPAKKVSTKARK